MKPQANIPRGPGLARYTWFLAAATLVLITAGGTVTSSGSGLAVPDWPSTYGQNMFLFPWARMVGGILYEHGHRLIASTVGLLTILLCALLWREPRSWVRRLGWLALAAVVTQGLLGGLTVHMLLPPAVSASHACLAQAFLALVVALAVFLSPVWTVRRKGDRHLFEDEKEPVPADRRKPRFFRLALFTGAAIYIQLILGAVMRHTGAGAAIPDFPLVQGGLWPADWAPGVALHYAHRVWALVVGVHVFLLLARAAREHARETRLIVGSALLVALLAVQVGLGAWTVFHLVGVDELAPLAHRAFSPPTFHVAVGAAMLGLTTWLAVWAAACRGDGVPTRAGASGSTGSGKVQATGSDAPGRGAGKVVADYLALTKPRISVLVLATTALGYYLGAQGAGSWGMLAWTLLGTGLLASGTSALNQYMEREADARMTRTADRPLPAGRIRPGSALAYGLALVVAGATLLLWRVNGTTACVGFATAALYVLAYTPLKRRTPLCTTVGAVPGALPPVMGWTAATGAWGPEATALFGILFLWQLPHFWAIAWIYRDQYAAAGMPMLTVVDSDGRLTGRWIMAHLLALLPVSLAPGLLGVSGGLYLAGAAALGLGYLALGWGLARRRDLPAARRLFWGSLVYLPALLFLMGADRLP